MLPQLEKNDLKSSRKRKTTMTNNSISLKNLTKNLQKNSSISGKKLLYAKKLSKKQPFQIEDFYLTKLGINLTKTSRKFQNVKKSHLGSLIKNSSTIHQNKSKSNHTASTNIFAKSSITIPAEIDCKPSYGEYVNTMPSEIRLLFHKSINMKNLFKDFDMAYYCLEEVKERVKCYKIELGVIMEKNVVSLKKIIDKMLINASRIINDHKDTNDQITKKNLKEMETVVEEKDFFQRRCKQLDQLLDMYKCERDYLEHQLTALKNEVE